MVLKSDTIVNPGTMVIESFDAALADRAVLGARSSNCKAVGAQLDVIHRLEQLHEVYFGLFQIPWIATRSSGQGD